MLCCGHCAATVASLLQRIVTEHFPNGAAAPTVGDDSAVAKGTAPANACSSIEFGWIGAAPLDWAEVAAADSYSTLDLAQQCLGIQKSAEYANARADSRAVETGGSSTWDVILVSDCVYEPLYGESWVRSSNPIILIVAALLSCCHAARWLRRAYLLRQSVVRPGGQVVSQQFALLLTNLMCVCCIESLACLVCGIADNSVWW